MLFNRLLPRFEDDPATPAAPAVPAIKSWEQMRKEARTQARKKYAEKLGLEEKKDETPVPKVDEGAAAKVEDKDEEKPEVKTPKVEEPKIDVEAVTRKAAREAADEAATKVAAETKKAFEVEVQKILDKDKSLVEKQKELDELIPIYQKENRLPKDYPEMISEQLRITEARWAQLEREKATKAEESKPVETPAPPAPPEDKRLEEFQQQIQSDLEEIFAGKFLAKPTNLEEINNENTTDPAAREVQKVMAFGVKLNVERKTQGLAPVTSLNKIYFLHYKPLADTEAKKSVAPPGGDAPVSPSSNQSAGESNKPQPFYQKGEDGRYHAKSWAQIKYEQMRARLK